MPIVIPIIVAILTWGAKFLVGNGDMPVFLFFVPGLILLPVGFYFSFAQRGQGRILGLILNTLVSLPILCLFALQVYLWIFPLHFN